MADNSNKEGFKDYVKKDYHSTQSSDRLTGGQNQGTTQQQQGSGSSGSGQTGGGAEGKE